MPRCVQNCSRLMPVINFETTANLSKRAITVGGVQNVGNTCVLSTMLQEFATDECYDVFFKTQRNNPLHSAINRCIEEIREGKTVQKAEIRNIFRLLGRQEELLSYWKIQWKQLLHQIAPFLFPPPAFTVNPHELYTLIALALFTEETTKRIVISTQDTALSLPQFIEKSPSFQEADESLWRITDPKIEEKPLEEFRVKNLQFLLKVVHVRQDNHVIVYRKSGKSWICCNDEKVSEVDSLPAKNIYGLVYECRSL